MTSRLAAIVVAATIIASYGLLAAASPQATAEADAEGVKPLTHPDAETRTPLPAGAADLLVDDAHRQVLISLPSTGSVVVAGVDGHITGTITGLTNPGEMTLTPDSSTVYVIGRGASTIAAIDTVTHAVIRASLPEGTCPASVTFTAGKVWYSYAMCSEPSSGGVGWFDPTSRQATNGVLTVPPGHIRALAERPDRLVLVEKVSGKVHVYDVTSDVLTVVAEGADAGDGCKDAALMSGGDHVVTSCGNSGNSGTHLVFATSDLSPTLPFYSWYSAAAVAVVQDQRYIAVAGTGQDRSAVVVYNIEYGPGGWFRHSFTPSDNGLVLDGILAMAQAGQLFAVVRNPSLNRDELAVFHAATMYATSIDMTLMDGGNVVRYQEPVRVSGTMSGTWSSTPRRLSVTRTDRKGTVEVATMLVGEEGEFGFRDTPRTTGEVRYVAEFTGDDEHLPGKGSLTVYVRPLPYDLNADGYAELIVGAPGEDLGTALDAGMFHMLHGRASGVSGAGSVAIHQDTPGVPGVAESGDKFGYANARGDFNADGYADIAVSAPGEDIGPATDGGAVWVFFGSAAGLRPNHVTTVDAVDAPIPVKDHASLGRSLVAGDNDGDGFDDLAIGAPGAGPGYVVMARGTRKGLSPTMIRIDQGSPGIPGVNRRGDRFGWSVALGDTDKDGRHELAVGAPGDSEDRGWATGSVTVVSNRFQGIHSTRWTKNTAGVPGAAGSFNLATGDSPDSFGHHVVFADFNGDTLADLVVAAPGSPVTVDGVRKRDAGTVTVLYSQGGISTGRAFQLTQQTTGIPGIAGQEDKFGSTLAAGSTNGDRSSELAVYSPGDGYVTVVPGSFVGLWYSTAKAWTQNSPGIPDATEPGDGWGDSLRFVELAATDQASLLVGAPGENDNRGACTLIHRTASGLTGIGAQYFSQDLLGPPGWAEPGDRFGTFS
ncbi:MAG TPA: hypothetical protein VFZ32_13055 [Micromonosporaceae bacterium]